MQINIRFKVVTATKCNEDFADNRPFEIGGLMMAAQTVCETLGHKPTLTRLIAPEVFIVSEKKFQTLWNAMRSTGILCYTGLQSVHWDVIFIFNS
jgi:hypothetical protein